MRLELQTSWNSIFELKMCKMKEIYENVVYDKKARRANNPC